MTYYTCALLQILYGCFEGVYIAVSDVVLLEKLTQVRLRHLHQPIERQFFVHQLLGIKKKDLFELKDND
jgi:hypothetical protein